MLNLSMFGGEMNLDDLMCPICREILIEPVTLPCRHSLCLKCLQITFKQRSLSCPLCNMRVGSWLRTATKSQTLVNNHLWRSIQSTFSKQIQDYYPSAIPINQDNITLFIASNTHSREKIPQEYTNNQMQLHTKQKSVNKLIIDDVNDGDRKKFIISDDFLIKEKNFHKNFKKQNVINNGSNYFHLDNKYKSTNTNLIVDGNKLQSNNNFIVNKNLLSEVEIEKEEKKDNGHGVNQEMNAVVGEKNMKIDEKQFELVDKTLNNVGMTLINTPQLSKPSCSYTLKVQNNSKYTLKSKPKSISKSKKDDTLNNVKANLLSTEENDDKRIDSAQSTGSHDSINPEIHHFKPIKVIPRTPLKITQDGRQIDPKLIRVMPILKRISNPVLKPPSSIQLQHVIGSTWSAFKEYIGQIERNLKIQKNVKNNSADVSSNVIKNCQLPSDTARKLELISASSSFDNKNYTKKLNQLINGINISKKLLQTDRNTLDSSNSLVSENNIKEIDDKSGVFIEENVFDDVVPVSLNKSDNLDEKIESKNDFCVIENIAERIKRRKVNSNVNKKSNNAIESKNKIANGKRSADDEYTNGKTPPEKHKKLKTSKSKLKTNSSPSNDVKPAQLEVPNINNNTITAKRRRNKTQGIRNSKLICQDKNSDEKSKIENEIELNERLLLQEKEDYEFAQRLQAELNEMERISTRARRSHRVIQYNSNLMMDKTLKNNKLQSTTNPRKNMINKIRSKI